jgi:hypothetical protein
MSIGRAVTFLFGLGDGREADQLKASQSSNRPKDGRRNEAAEVRLYGEAEAIRVLYQTAFLEKHPPKPPRPRRGRGVWVARYLSSFSPSLQSPAGAKA